MSNKITYTITHTTSTVLIFKNNYLQRLKYYLMKG